MLAVKQPNLLFLFFIENYYSLIRVAIIIFIILSYEEMLPPDINKRALDRLTASYVQTSALKLSL